MTVFLRILSIAAYVSSIVCFAKDAKELGCMMFAFGVWLNERADYYELKGKMK